MGSTGHHSLRESGGSLDDGIEPLERDDTPSIGGSAKSTAIGCAIIATSMSSKQPLFTMMHLPPYISSAGVPRMTTRASAGAIAPMRPIAAPTPAVAIRLWPQACPISGSASYSAQMAIVAGPWPHSPRNAVSMP